MLNIFKALARSKMGVYWQCFPKYADSEGQKQEFIQEMIEIMDSKIKVKQ